MPTGANWKGNRFYRDDAGRVNFCVQPAPGRSRYFFGVEMKAKESTTDPIVQANRKTYRIYKTATGFRDKHQPAQDDGKAINAMEPADFAKILKAWEDHQNSAESSHKTDDDDEAEDDGDAGDGDDTNPDDSKGENDDADAKADDSSNIGTDFGTSDESEDNPTQAEKKKSIIKKEEKNAAEILRRTQNQDAKSLGQRDRKPERKERQNMEKVGRFQCYCLRLIIITHAAHPD